ncbi:Arginyl-tRNA synthetase, partial [Mesomycoplasma hyorhinis]
MSFFKETGTKIFLEEIKKDLAQIGIHFDVFSSEKKLYQDKKIDNLLSSLKHTYKKDDALW